MKARLLIWWRVHLAARSGLAPFGRSGLGFDVMSMAFCCRDGMR